MVYPYSCAKCDIEFDVVKHHSKSSSKEKCPECKRVAKRIYTAPFFTGTKVEDAEYNPGLGIVTKNSRHRKEEARARGLEEIGNEKPTSTREHFQKVREAKRKKVYEEFS